LHLQEKNKIFRQLSIIFILGCCILLRIYPTWLPMTYWNFVAIDGVIGSQVELSIMLSHRWYWKKVFLIPLREDSTCYYVYSSSMLSISSEFCTQTHSTLLQSRKSHAHIQHIDIIAIFIFMLFDRRRIKILCGTAASISHIQSAISKYEVQQIQCEYFHAPFSSFNSDKRINFVKISYIWPLKWFS
jgi:hypothetical protein